LQVVQIVGRLLRGTLRLQ
jgi:hypothetical protein